MQKSEIVIRSIGNVVSNCPCCPHSNVYIMGEILFEKKFKAQVQKLGALAVKLAAVGMWGFPDRTVLYRGRAFFVEMKNPNGKGRLSDRQKWWRAKLWALGFEYWVIQSEEDINTFIERIQDEAI